MSQLKIRIKKVNENAIIPKYAFYGDSGFDFYAIENVRIYPNEQALLQTGLVFEIPLGYEMQLRPRSGLALKKCITMTNSPGTIDSTYRGEVGILLFNLGREPFIINKGDKIAQGVIQKVELVEFEEVDELSATERGSGGYGHTG